MKHMLLSKWLVPVCILSCLGSFIIGYHEGTSRITAQWNQAKNEEYAYITKLQQEYLNKESQYITEINNLKVSYDKVKQQYTNKLTELKSTYTVQLQQSQQRTEIYKRKALSTSGCSSLADYTSRLDRSLTEGRNLVRELREFIKLRDNQIKYIQHIYKAEHKVND